MAGPGHVVCESNSQVVCTVHFCQYVVIQMVKRIRNRSGPQEFTASSLERQSSIVTLWVLDVRKALIRSRVCPDIPQNFQLTDESSVRDCIEDLLKSSTPMSICSLRSMRWYMSWGVMSSCDSLECKLRKPWFTGVRIPWPFSYARIYEHNMCSNNLQAAQVSETVFFTEFKHQWCLNALILYPIVFPICCRLINVYRFQDIDIWMVFITMLEWMPNCQYVRSRSADWSMACRKAIWWLIYICLSLFVSL